MLRPINRGAVCTDGFRFSWEDQAAIDVYGTDRVEVMPLPGWRGALPLPFYSTVAALLLAGRGAVPFHACTVAIDGCAVLLCGPTGAGKSTLTAGLAGQGARLVSDDLSVFDPARLTMLPGRPKVRLFKAVADLIGISGATAVRDDPRNKVVAAFDTVLADNPLPLAAVLLLQDDGLPEPLALRFALLRRQLFRPKWLNALPGHVERQSAIREIARSVPMIAVPPLGRIDSADFDSKCGAIRQQIIEALG